MSKDGAQYYIGIQNLMQSFMRPVRACRGLGMHLIVTSHVSEKEVKATSIAGAGSTAHMPLIPGAFREQLPGYFDVVLHAGLDRVNPYTEDGGNNPAKPRHYVKWMPDARRPSKSRVGFLSPQEKLSNEWLVLKPLIDNALAQRSKKK